MRLGRIMSENQRDSRNAETVATTDRGSFITTTALLQGLADPSNAAAWQAFVQRYRPVVLGYSRKLGVSEADSDDVAQQVFAEFSRGFASGAYQREKGRLRGWLFGIARNQVRAWHRGRAEAGPLCALAGEPEAHDTEIGRVWEREWETQMLRRCMMILRDLVNPRTLEAFVLFALEDRPAEMVAEQLGMTMNAVYGAKRRVLDQIAELRQQLEDEA